jgi:PST family polysaccharide transporter
MIKPSQLYQRVVSFPLFQNLSWMIVSEGMARASRLVTLFVLANQFSNRDYGLAMLALLIHELFRVFTRLGTGARIIQCDNSVLLSTLGNAATLQWCVTLLISTLQILLAELIANYYDYPELATLLKWMAIAHLCYPLVSVRIFESQRQNKLRYFGIASGICVSFENLCVALLATTGFGIYAIVYAKIAAAIAWVGLFWRLPSLCSRCIFEAKSMRSLLAFSSQTLSSELTRTLRFQADSLIAARLLTPDMFGLYTFAKSAGLGIAQSFTMAYQVALYPYLCKQNRAGNGGIAFRKTWYVTLGICTLFAAQALLAPVYIELLFGQRWENAEFVSTLLCVIAIPTLIMDHAGLTLRANNQPARELLLIALCTTSLFVTLAIALPNSPQQMATYFLVSSITWLTLLWFPVFGQRSVVPPNNKLARIAAH